MDEINEEQFKKDIDQIKEIAIDKTIPVKDRIDQIANMGMGFLEALSDKKFISKTEFNEQIFAFLEKHEYNNKILIKIRNFIAENITVITETTKEEKYKLDLFYTEDVKPYIPFCLNGYEDQEEEQFDSTNFYCAKCDKKLIDETKYFAISNFDLDSYRDSMGYFLTIVVFHIIQKHL